MPDTRGKAEKPTEINSDLIRQVADQVYKLLLEEARTDYERRRISRSFRRYFGGR